MSSEKKHVSIVVAGHVDAGKSSLTGRLLYDMGGIDERMMEKLNKKAAENGKPSFAFAYFMDNQKAEQERQGENRENGEQASHDAGIVRPANGNRRIE